MDHNTPVIISLSNKQVLFIRLYVQRTCRADICHANLTYIWVSPTPGTPPSSSSHAEEQNTSETAGIFRLPINTLQRDIIVTVKWLMPALARSRTPQCAQSGCLADANGLTLIISAKTLSFPPYVWFGHWPGQMDMHRSLLETTVSVACYWSLDQEQAATTIFPVLHL